MTLPAVIAIITPLVLIAVTVGSILLRRALQREELLLEEISLAFAWVFIVGSLVWLSVYLNGSTLLGYSAPWTWLTAAHFAFAGFGALTITALCCRVVSHPGSLKILRSLLIIHPLAYLVTAAGILGYPYCDEIGATTYGILFITQLAAVILGNPHRIARAPLILVLLSLTVPLVTMIPAIAWAWSHPIFNLMGMVRYHGIVNAIGHVGLGLCAFVWGRPPSHSAIQKTASPAT